jgi:DNA-binding response OmpR family regulator
MRVLLIEDDDRIAEFLERGLRAEGHHTQRARTGPDGLKLALGVDRANEPAEDVVIVLDVMLPGMSGLEVCQTLRAARTSVPILMLSALDAVEDRVAGLRLGADDYLGKPFSFDELLARLQALVRRKYDDRSQPDARLVVGDLVFDRERMEATRAGRVLTLTARELALLELLMSAPGRLFSRERILSTVWGSSEDPLTNVVDVYIRRLRTKVDEGFDRPLIHTVRGLGYRLEAT